MTEDFFPGRFPLLRKVEETFEPSLVNVENPQRLLRVVSGDPEESLLIVEMSYELLVEME